MGYKRWDGEVLIDCLYLTLGRLYFLAAVYRPKTAEQQVAWPRWGFVKIFKFFPFRLTLSFAFPRFSIHFNVWDKKYV